MGLNKKAIKEQTRFCKDLMDRLSKSVDENIEQISWERVHNHTQISNDIVRLRRELNTLNKMLHPYSGK